MISTAHVALMATYNQWQNNSLYTAADGLSEADRRADRGAVFQSIHATLSHILWADDLWLSRFTDHPAPYVGIPESTHRHDDWEKLKIARTEMDQTLMRWANGLAPEDVQGDLTWYSGAMDGMLTRPKWLLFTHLFNHATHHRGQVHAMLTAAGAKPEDTDIPFMPGLAERGF